MGAFVVKIVIEFDVCFLRYSCFQCMSGTVLENSYEWIRDSRWEMQCIVFCLCLCKEGIFS